MLGDETFRPGHGTGVFVFALPDNMQQASK
jgi:hypothetical protein